MRGLAANVTRPLAVSLAGEHPPQGLVRFESFERFIPVGFRIAVHVREEFTDLHAQTLNLGKASVEGEGRIVRIVVVVVHAYHYTKGKGSNQAKSEESSRSS